MTARRACPPAAGPLEEYAASFDGLFASLAQRRGFREYLTGLLLPRERNKTLTALAGAEPVVGAQDPAVQRLQFFLSEAHWDAERVNDRRLELLAADPVTAAHEGGVLVVDDSGDRKDGHATAYVARQYLGSVGKTDNGIVVVSTLWADERVYYPLHVHAYTPAGRLPAGSNDPGFATKPKLAADLVGRAVTGGVPFAAVVADNFYGPSETDTLISALHDAGLPYVLALKPHMGVIEAAQDVGWRSQRRPGGWHKVTRRLRDGHTETWWAADATLGSWGPDQAIRLVVVSTDPGRLPKHTTWYLVTNRPRPGSPRAVESGLAPAGLGEVVRCYGLRNWVEQGYKQVKHELGWADFQVRGQTAIHRHYTLVCCAFSFCWQAGLVEGTDDGSGGGFDDDRPDGDRAGAPAAPAGLHRRAGRVERGSHHTVHIGQTSDGTPLAGPAPPDPGLADPGHTAATLLARLVQRAPTSPAARPTQRRHRRTSDQPLPPALTNHR
jgi:SRSO17 transposase